MIEKVIPVQDIREFSRLLERSKSITTSPEGRKIYNRLYLKLGDLSLVYRILGREPMRRGREGKSSIEEAEKLFFEEFRLGRVKKLREFAQRHINATRLLRKRYRFLSEAARHLLPDLFLYNGKIVVTREEVEEKLREIAERHGRILITEGRKKGGKGVPPRMVQEAVKFYFGDLETAARKLKLPYKKLSKDKEVRKIVDLLVTVKKVGKETNIYRLMNIVGNSGAISVYRYLRKLGEGDYRKGLQILRSLNKKQLTDWVSRVKGVSKGACEDQ